MIALADMPHPPQAITENVTDYPIVPKEAKQSWTLSVREQKDTSVPQNNHQQFILVAEGQLNATKDGQEQTLPTASYITLDQPHTLHTSGAARYFVVDLDAQVTELSPIADNYYSVKIDLGDHIVYDLIAGDKTDNKWSVAYLEIQDSPTHYHKIETEIFLVLEGNLKALIDNEEKIFHKGQVLNLSPNTIHRISSANSTPVQVLCFNFPAFDPSDMHLAE